MSDDKFAYLRKQLETEFSFPLKYMFKFIVPHEKVEEVKPLFESGVMQERLSSTGKYKSITITMIVLSPDDVIDKYKSVAHIEGIVAL
ncbi:MAG: DUF493 family protein [Bacteroidetes bacterium]|nr:DUF493 family protein [Bacteroidota bacterium]